VDECESLTIGIYPQKKHKKEGIFVSEFPFTTINPITGTWSALCTSVNIWTKVPTASI